jgi:hypothetical protein
MGLLLPRRDGRNRQVDRLSSIAEFDVAYNLAAEFECIRVRISTGNPGSTVRGDYEGRHARGRDGQVPDQADEEAVRVPRLMAAEVCWLTTIAIL